MMTRRSLMASGGLLSATLGLFGLAAANDQLQDEVQVPEPARRRVFKKLPSELQFYRGGGWVDQRLGFWSQEDVPRMTRAAWREGLADVDPQELRPGDMFTVEDEGRGDLMGFDGDVLYMVLDRRAPGDALRARPCFVRFSDGTTHSVAPLPQIITHTSS